MINTYNESELHHSLKIMYCEQYNGKTEVKLHGHIYDILSDSGIVIEIQTKNLSKLLPKILNTIEHGHKVILVYPLVINKWIELYDENGSLISKRKSPQTQSIYNIFNELTGIYPVLLDKNFTLEVVETYITEKRKRTPEPVQTINCRRRFKRNWIKTGKELKEIIKTRKFNQPEDFLNLIPIKKYISFCAKDISEQLKKDKTLPSSAAKNSHLMIWVLSKMNLIIFSETKNRSRFYKLNSNYIPPDAYGTFDTI
ncbi:MAG: hypothetical protein HUK25_03975 [Treponema sp.]|nr:hypothetical protein [Treponema sp.]